MAIKDEITLLTQGIYSEANLITPMIDLAISFLSGEYDSAITAGTSTNHDNAIRSLALRLIEARKEFKNPDIPIDPAFYFDEEIEAMLFKDDSGTAEKTQWSNDPISETSSKSWSS